MFLTLAERETIFLYSEAEQTASIDTCNQALIRRLDAFTAKSPAITLVREDEHGKCYHLPKSWIKVNMPKQLSAELRQELSEKMRQKNADRQ